MDTPGVFPSFVTVIVSSPCGVCLGFFSVLFLCLCHSAFHQVGNGEHVSRGPHARLLFPDSLSLAALGVRSPCCSEQMGTLIRCCTERAASPASLQQHSRVLHQVSYIPVQTGSSFCFQLQWCDWYLSGFLRVVHFSLNDRCFSICPVVQLSPVWE